MNNESGNFERIGVSEMENGIRPAQPTLRIPPDAVARLQMLAQAADRTAQGTIQALQPREGSDSPAAPPAETDIVTFSSPHTYQFGMAPVLHGGYGGRRITGVSHSLFAETRPATSASPPWATQALDVRPHPRLTRDPPNLVFRWLLALCWRAARIAVEGQRCRRKLGDFLHQALLPQLDLTELLEHQ